MATKKYVFCQQTSESDYYSIVLVPKGKEFDVKICKVCTHAEPDGVTPLTVPDKYLILDYSDQAFYNAVDFLHPAALLQMLDPYFRMKLNGSKLYRCLYRSLYSEPNYNSSLIKCVTRNMIVLDRNTLLYLHHLVDNMNDDARHAFYLLCQQPLPYNPLGRNARTRLGISKNKEKVLKRFPYYDILVMDNKVFEDDVDFLLSVSSAVNDTTGDIIKKILYTKKVNPKLSYQQIVKVAIMNNVDNETETVSFKMSCSHIEAQAKYYEMFKSKGYDRQLKLVSIAPIRITYFDKLVAAPEPTFSVPNAKIYPITCPEGLSYANALADGMPLEYLLQAVSVGSHFYLVIKHGRHYLLEEKDGFVVNAKRNATNALIEINYQ